jgi:hypothetical protein
VIKTTWGAFRRFWGTDSSLSTLLALLVVLIFVVPILGFVGSRGRLVLDGVFTLLVVAGMAVVSRQTKALALVAGVGIVGLAIRWLGRLVPSPSLEIATAISSVASIVALIYIVIVQVFQDGPVNMRRIQGAIAIYLLLGLAWGEAYYALALARPGAFSIATSADEPASWIYFSFVTLTTVGYGDITPVAPVARSLAVLEALSGQLYPAILLARLVALEVGSR